MPVEFAAAGNAPRNELFLLKWAKDQSPFDQMEDTVSAVAGGLRFNGGLTSQKKAGGLADEVLASYSDGSACLVVTSCGAGTLAVLNADLMSSNLPSSPLFVPLVQELSGKLLAASDSPEPAAGGEPMRFFCRRKAGPGAGDENLQANARPDESIVVSDESSGVLLRANAAGCCRAFIR